MPWHRVSPDSRTLAYARLKLSTYHTDLDTIGVDGTGARKLVGDIVGGSAKWSPTGSVIAFSKGDNIYTIRSDGSGLRPVAAKASEPSWSADGSDLLYTTGRFRGGEESDIVIAKVGRRHGRRLSASVSSRWLERPSALAEWNPAVGRRADSATRLASAHPTGHVRRPDRGFDSGRPTCCCSPQARRSQRPSRLGRPARRLSSVPQPCDADAGPLGEVVLAGDRLAWTCVHYHPMGDTEDFHLRMERLGEASSSAVAGNCTGGEQVGSLVGGDGTLVFGSFAGRSPRVRFVAALVPPADRGRGRRSHGGRRRAGCHGRA